MKKPGLTKKAFIFWLDHSITSPNKEDLKEIKEILRRKKARFLANKRFSHIFSNIEVGHVFANNANLKKLIVRTKVS